MNVVISELGKNVCKAWSDFLYTLLTCCAFIQFKLLNALHLNKQLRIKVNISSITHSNLKEFKSE